MVNGEVWDDETEHRRVAERGVGYVFQEPSLFDHLSVEGNLMYGYRRCPPGRRRIEFAQTVDWLGLAPLLNRSVSGLSGGEAQRVAIGRALLSSPRLLLLDEPLAALDRARKQEILPFLERLHAELSIPMLYVSHSLDEVVRLADTLLLMAEGRVVERGPVRSVLTSEAGRHAMDEPFSMVIGQVVVACSEHRLTEVAVGEHRIRLPRAGVADGQAVRLRLQARDISLALSRPTQTSILNCLPATVTDIGPLGEDGQRLVTLTLDGNAVLARVSGLSCEKLGLKPGLDVFAQIKAASVVQ